MSLALPLVGVPVPLPGVRVPFLDVPAPFLGVPGGVELLVLLLVALVVFGLPVVLIGAGLYAYRNVRSDRSTSEEVEALRQEVEHLREEIERLTDER